MRVAIYARLSTVGMGNPPDTGGTFVAREYDERGLVQLAIRRKRMTLKD
jgi:hypothetical protein